MNTERTTSLSGARILIIEDEYYLADDLSRILVQSGAEVLGPVGSVEEADRMVAAGGFDCAVVDMNLRGNFAFAIAERLRAAHVPFVLATGYNHESLPETLKDAPRIEKPYAPENVAGMLAALRDQGKLTD